MKTLLKLISVVIVLVMISISSLCAITVHAKSDEDIALENSLLGSVSAKYESNGNPGTISNGVGDPGGSSYGAYQFAGSYNVPYSFALWCINSSNGVSIGNRLVEAYNADGGALSANFVNTWQAIANEDSAAFLKLQHDYIKVSYYDSLVSGLKNNMNFDVDNYGIALKNAVWARAVQQGVGSFSGVSGAAGLFVKANQALSGGLLASSETDIISAVYHEAGLTVDGGSNPMHASNAGSNAWIITQYGLEGKTLSHYSGSSSAVQASVWLRLNVNELNDLLNMYSQYGGSHETGIPAWTVCQSGGVNIRSGNSTESAIIITVPNATQLTVTGESDNGWYPVSMKHENITYTGFCYSDYVTFTDPAANVDRLGFIANADSTVNIRAQATTDSAILVSVMTGTLVTVHGALNAGWYSVSLDYNGVHYDGYCFGEYVDVDDPDNPNPPEPAGIGDIDCDGSISSSDALLVLQYSVRKIDFTDDEKALADVNADGNIDSNDALNILLYSIGKLESF